MKKAFFALLFLSFAGAGVLFWLMRSSSHDEKVVAEATHEEHADKEHAEGDAEHGEDKDAKLSEEDSHEAVAADHSAAKEAEQGAEHGEEAEPNAAVAHGGEGEAAAEHGDESGAPAAGHEEDADDSDKTPPSLTIHTEPPAAKVWVDGKPRGETPIEIPLLPKAQMVQLEAEGYAEFTRLAPSDKEAGSGQLNWKIQLKEGKSSGHASHGAAKEKAKKVAAAPKPAKAKHEVPVIHGAPPPVKPAAETPVEAALKKETAQESAKETAKEAAKEHLAAKEAVKAPAKTAAHEAPAPQGLKTGKVGPYVIQMQSIRREGEWVAEVSAALSRAPASETGAFGCRVKLPDGSEWVRILAGPFGSKAEAAERLTALRKVQPEAFVAKSQKCLP